MATDRPGIDPELLKYVGAFPDLDFRRRTLADVRKDVSAAFVQGEPGSDADVSVEQHSVAVGAGSPPVKVYLYEPKVSGATPRPAIVHFHPGGFILGSAAMSDALNRKLARELQCVVCSVDYRLAPETSYPGQLNDGYAALRWLRDEAGTLGVDPAKIVLKGESAGGGLAVAVALAARDRKELAVAHLHLIQPMLDDRTGQAPEGAPRNNAPVWTADCNTFAWRAVLGSTLQSASQPGYAVPARAQELSGLPPTYISVGALDLFLDEDLDFARRLARCAVSVELHVYPGAYHGFDLIPDAAVSQRASHDSLRALERALGR